MPLSQAERDLLEMLTDDGLPLGFVGDPLDQAGIMALQSTALSLLQRGLIGVYGHPDEATDVPPEELEAVLQSMRERALEDSGVSYEPAPDLPPAEAEAVLRSIENWTSPNAPIWVLWTTPDGDAVLADDA